MFGLGARKGFGWLRRGNRRTAELVAEALNARRYDALGELITDDLVYLDTMSNTLHGLEAFVSANLRLHRDAPDLTIVLEDFSEASGAMLIRGRTVSANTHFCSDSLWQVSFADGKVSQLQAFREHNAVSLPAIAARREDEESV